MSLRLFTPIVLLALPAMLAHNRAGAAPAGQLDASPALFSVIAAINAAGYDAELTSPRTVIRCGRRYGSGLRRETPSRCRG